MKTNKVTQILLGVIAVALIIIVVVLVTRKKPMSKPMQVVVTNPFPSLVSVPAPAATATPVARISVPGMLKYVDKDLGYSFWYPNSWKVTETTNGAVPEYPLLSGGSVTKTLTVGPSDSTPGGLVIEDFVSTTKQVADNDSNCSSPYDPSCPAFVAYHFDSTSHLWMKKIYSQDTHSSQDDPADISVNTMGGLHIFPGNPRSTNGVIIPLSANHFVVVSDSDPKGINIRPFADTIVALNPAVATPVAPANQERTILAEMAAYAGL